MRDERVSDRARCRRRACPPALSSLISHPSSLFKLADAVAEAGGLLVRFLVDRLLELLAQLDQFRLGLLILRQPARRLAAVTGFAVDALQERDQLFAELLVVVRAAEAAGVAELDKFDAAHRAGALVQGRRLVTLFG